MVLGHIVGAILGMDLISTRVGTDKVTYVYRTCGLLAQERIQKLKAKLMSILGLPSDLPIDIRVNPEKRGILVKSYIVEVDVPAKPFKLR